MSRSEIPRALRGREWLNHTERLSRTERAVLLAVVVFIVGFDVIGLTTSDTGGLDRIVSIVSTLTLVLYIWSPLIATLALGVVTALALTTVYASTAMMAGALATILLMRLASPSLIIASFSGILLVLAIVSSGVGPSTVAPSELAIFTFIGAVSGAVGIGLRSAYARGRRLEYQLDQRKEHERQAIIAERQWIAGELHDSIAHQLTIVSLHAQLLDDAQMQDTSQEAIRTAARKALSDLRFIIKLAEAAPAGTEIPSGDLQSAISEVSAEFQGAGHSIDIEGDPRNDAIPRGAEIILARVVRESATNILKYAGPGEVRFVLDVEPEAVTMTICSPLSKDSTPRVASSTGTGLNRMTERVLGVSGEFSAGPVGNEWQVRTHLPFYPSQEDALNGDPTPHLTG